LHLIALIFSDIQGNQVNQVQKHCLLIGLA
jgi:hypothetical protein